VGLVGSTRFTLLVIGACAFVWLTSLGLPAVVASHFGATGVANGFMPRAFYIRFMLAFAIGMPVLIVVLSRWRFDSPGARLNLPNRDYWLAPERRHQTVSFLRQHMLRFGATLLVFLCYVHWLVVRANEAQPAHIPVAWLWGGVAAFVVATLIWLKSLLGRFRNLP
jgi:hypothetical protein